MTYELDPYAPKIYRVSENKLRTSSLSKVIVGQTDRHDRNYYHSRFAGDKIGLPHDRTASNWIT